MDIRLARLDPKSFDYICDLQIVDGDLDATDPLTSAVMLSIFTDRRAQSDDALMSDESPRGWWGDTYAQVSGDLMGSRLWLLRRSKQTTQTLSAAREYVAEALSWLVADGVASSIDVQTSVASASVMGIVVTITKPQGLQTFNFSYAWDGIN